MKVSSTHLLQGIEGYGQLSISSSAVRIVAATVNAAGVWALVGAAPDVDKLKAAGPATSAAVVAHSTDSHIAVAADSQMGIGVSATTHNPKAAAISATNPGGLAGSFNGNVTVSGLGTFGTLTTTSTASFPGVAVNGNINVSGIIYVTAGGDIQVAGADCAENFDVTDRDAGPGTVMGSWIASPTVPGARYTFAVKGGTYGGILGNYLYSDWGPTVKATAPFHFSSLRLYLRASGINPSAQRLRSLTQKQTSVREFMKL